MLARALVLAALLVLMRARAEADPFARVAFDRVARGELEDVVFLGYSADGKRLAYLRAQVLDGSGFLQIDAVELDADTGKTLVAYHLPPSAEPGARAVMRQRARYDAFLTRMKQAGISMGNARAWKADGKRRLAPDGKLSLGWRVGKERSDGGDESGPMGRIYAATLDDPERDDHAVLFELFQGQAGDGVTRHFEPALIGAWSNPDGSAFIVLTRSDGKQMCWYENAYYAQVFSLTKIRATKPAREANAQGMLAYRAGKHRDAQAAFRRALELDPDAPRARYNLAAVSARLGDDAEAVKTLRPFGAHGAELLLFKIATDPDFAGAKNRPTLSAYLDTLRGRASD